MKLSGKLFAIGLGTLLLSGCAGSYHISDGVHKTPRIYSSTVIHPRVYHPRPARPAHRHAPGRHDTVIIHKPTIIRPAPSRHHAPPRVIRPPQHRPHLRPGQSHRPAVRHQRPPQRYQSEPRGRAQHHRATRGSMATEGQRSSAQRSRSSQPRYSGRNGGHEGRSHRRQEGNGRH